jgi:hypothetical protein
MDAMPETPLPAGPAREPYERPELVVYGDVHHLTQAVGQNGNLDGGDNPGQMSSLP